MKNIDEKSIIKLFPDSTTKNNLYYKKTNEKIYTFLKNHFTNDCSYNNIFNNYKFPIKNLNLHIKKKPIRRNNTLINEKKSNIRTLIESLQHENFTSYNYYNNTKGRLKSAKIRKKNNIIFRQKSDNNLCNNNKFFILNSNTNNTNLLSNESNRKSSKSTFFKSSSALYNLKKTKFKNKEIFENNNLNSFSFSNNISSKRGNHSKNISTPQTPNSTRYKSKINKYSLKLDYDSLSFNINMNNNSRNKSSFSLQPLSIYKNNIKIDDANSVNRKTLSYINSSRIRLGESQREFHQKLFLQHLRSQVNKFEHSNSYYIDENQIRSNLLSPTKFHRDVFMKKVKKAAKYNDFFFKKFPFQKYKFGSLKNKMKKMKKRNKIPPYHFIYNIKAKKILKSSQKIDKKLNKSRKLIKNMDLRAGLDKLKKIIDFVVPVEHKVRDIDEKLKDETINYQKNIGQFFIYNGSGIFSGHLSTFLKGDKIVSQVIKMESV